LLHGQDLCGQGLIPPRKLSFLIHFAYVYIIG
jgi:hypothetical protein